MRLLPAVLALILPACPAPSQTVRGAGARPCTEWSLARRDGGRDYEAEQWALGYISGVTASLPSRGSRQAPAPEAKSLFSDVDAYCTAHPNIMLWNALVAVMAAAHGT